MQRIERINFEHWNRVRNLVEEGYRCKQILTYYFSIPPHELTERDFNDLNDCYKAYADICKKLGTNQLEQIHERWANAKNKLIKNKVYPYNIGRRIKNARKTRTH